MESTLTNAYKIKIQNFEGPFDLLFHLLEKNQINIYDIPINEITDQYMEYLFSMQELDMEIASEFLIMAATLLHIKSKMLLPGVKDKQDTGEDLRDELVSRLVEYKKYKEFAIVLNQREKEWEKVFYKFPEVCEFEWEEEILELSPFELERVYIELSDKCKRRINPKAVKFEQIIEHEKISLKSKMREIIAILMYRSFFKFSEFFSPNKKSRIEVVTGFLAVLELSKLKKARVTQKKPFSDIIIFRYEDKLKQIKNEIMAENNQEVGS